MIERQIATAIELHFETATRFRSTRSPSRARGTACTCGGQGTDAIHVSRSVLERIVPERRAEARRQIDMARNFFKHAKKDGDRTLTFNPDSGMRPYRLPTPACAADR
jgi:hypothetical protein